MGIFKEFRELKEEARREKEQEKHKNQLMKLAYQVYLESYNKQWALERAGFSIRRKPVEGKVGVVYNGTRVLDINIYVPGEWEDELKKVYLILNGSIEPSEEMIEEIKHEGHIRELKALAGDVYLYACNNPEIRLKDYGFNIYHDKVTNKRVVEFNNVRVLDSSTYIPGEWEKLLKEVDLLLKKTYQSDTSYSNGITSYSEKDTFEKVKELLKYRKAYEVKISDNIVARYEHLISSHNITGVEATRDEGVRYGVYVDRKCVFYAILDSKNPNGMRVTTYWSGPWVDMLPSAIAKAKKEYEEWINGTLSSKKEDTIDEDLEKENELKQCLNEVARRYIKKINENM